MELDEYEDVCRDWLITIQDEAEERARVPSGPQDGREVENIAVFHDQEYEDVAIREARQWQRRKMDAGFGAIDWPVESGGAGLSAAHAQVYREVEAQFMVPPSHEVLRVTVGLAAPAVREVGTPWQRQRFLLPFLRADELVCQLFSEPSAGSDLAAISTRGRRDGEEWHIDGEKVWTSGARHAKWGLLLARTEPQSKRHEGLSVFLVPMGHAGVTVRPIRQMTGGASFSQVILDAVRVSDTLRLGSIGEGWKIAKMILGFERGQTGSNQVGGSSSQLIDLARRMNASRDPLIREDLVRVYSHERLREITRWRAASLSSGPEGSIGRILWVQGLLMVGDVAARILGPRMCADSGDGYTYTWANQVLGAPGFRIAGGTEEIQRNIIAERVLGLPR